jgi:hypothetical protein
MEKDRNQSEGPVAHAMVRIRPQNWKQVLPDFQLGWAENNREACLANLGPLFSVARAFTASKEKLDEKDLVSLSRKIHELADHLHTTHFFCPEGGEYVLSADGKTMTCTVHGSAKAPRQPPAPLGKSSVGELLDRFAGMTASLTFLEDGLHAVVTINRK